MVLVERYDDFSLGFADAVVISCAERHVGKVLTLNCRHFGVGAQERDDSGSAVAAVPSPPKDDASLAPHLPYDVI